MIVSTRGRYALRVMIDLAENSDGGIEYEDFAFAAGLCDKKDAPADLSPRDKRLLEDIKALSAGQRKTAEEFVRFLSRRG